MEDDTDKDHPGEILDGADTDEVRTWIITYFKYKAKLKKESRNCALAMMFIKKVDQSKYGDLCASLYNQFTRGTDQYPQSLTSAYNTVNEHRRESVTEEKKKKEGGGTNEKKEKRDDNKIQ